MSHLPPLATSLPASLSSPPSDTHTVTLGTYLSFAQYGVGVALLLRPLINMHSGSVCLVGVLSVFPLLSQSVSFPFSCMFTSSAVSHVVPCRDRLLVL